MQGLGVKPLGKEAFFCSYGKVCGFPEWLKMFQTSKVIQHYDSDVVKRLKFDLTIGIKC